MKYTEIKNQADACKILNREAKPGQELKDIADAINFLNNQHKPVKGDWYPIFWWDNAGGFGFSHSPDDGWRTDTLAGARLAFRFETSEEADYFGTEFLELHKQLFYS